MSYYEIVPLTRCLHRNKGIPGQWAHHLDQPRRSHLREGGVGGREGGRERGREGGREERREGEREGGRKGGSDGGREEGKKEGGYTN